MAGHRKPLRTHIGSADVAETACLRIKRAALRGKSVLLKPDECVSIYFLTTTVKARADLDDAAPMKNR